MTSLLPRLISILLTLLLVLGAAVALVVVWRHYEVEPWTRDGKLATDTVQVAADVSGLVTDVRVHDNAPVHAGDVLFVVDQERYSAALAQANAAVDSAKATQANARREQGRYLSLGDLISREAQDQRTTATQTTSAQLEQALANRQVAEINLKRSLVRAQVNGYVTGFSMRPGDYVTAGAPVFAVVDTDAYYVLGYFEETKLHSFQLGDRAEVTLLGDNRKIIGHVDSLSAGIADREQSGSSALLPNVTPTFSWIRLAQRVPVRVVIDSVPAGLRLVAGRTATVSIQPNRPRVVPRVTPATAVTTNTAPTQRQANPGPPAAIVTGPPR